MLTSAGMGGMEEMGIFYDGCLESLYPPGMCGAYCTQHTYDCFLADIQKACCDEGGLNCPPNQDIPSTCPVGCAIVFPDFLETCRAFVQEHVDLEEADYEAFEQECESPLAADADSPHPLAPSKTWPFSGAFLRATSSNPGA